MKISSAAQMQLIDARTINEVGIPGIVLMERAGLAVCRVIAERFPEARRAFLFCGDGNNGGDGFVIARELRHRGLDVRVHLTGRPENLKGDARTNFRALEKTGVPGRIVSSRAPVLSNKRGGTIVVDAIFGTGLSRNVSGPYRRVIERINASGLPVLSVDIPSGLSADSGSPLGAAVRATETVTFGLPKRGHLLFPGPLFSGRLTVADIGFPRSVVDEAGIDLQTNSPEEVRADLPDRPREAHKGTFGHLLVVAGSRGKSGAAALTGLAALRSGCGLVTLAVPESLVGSISRKFPEAMTLPLPETARGTISIHSLRALRRRLPKVSAMAIGPGISVDKDTMELVRALLRASRKPTVVDADAINCLMADAAFLETVRRPLILTPHPAEFGRLIESRTLEIQENRLDHVSDFIGRFSHVLALKGAHTLVGIRDQGIWMNLTGNAGMATAGSGDVLTGVVGALAAAGTPLPAAARVGVFIHGICGDLAAERKTERSMTATDMINELPAAFRRVESREIKPLIRTI